MVIAAMVIRDKVRQVSRGFGFVTYENPMDAEEAVKHMDGKVGLVSAWPLSCPSPDSQMTYIVGPRAPVLFKEQMSDCTW